MGWPELADGALSACLQGLGETISYTPEGGVAQTLRAIVDMNFEQVDPNTGAIVSSNQPMIGVRDVDLPQTPGPGDTCTVRSKAYKVIERQEDGQGGSRLILHET